MDTMVFKPSDVLLVHFRNVDFNYATKGIVLYCCVKKVSREIPQVEHIDLIYFFFSTIFSRDDLSSS